MSVIKNFRVLAAMKYYKKMFVMKQILTKVSPLYFLISLNPSLANVLILYPLKIQENLCFSGIFRGYIIGILARNMLIKTVVRLLDLFQNLNAISTQQTFTYENLRNRCEICSKLIMKTTKRLL